VYFLEGKLNPSNKHPWKKTPNEKNRSCLSTKKHTDSIKSSAMSIRTSSTSGSSLSEGSICVNKL
jgi:hypothetical protein